MADSLRELAMKATPGPWEEGVEGNGKPGYIYCDNAAGSAVAIAYGEALPFPLWSRAQEQANAAYIAAANPSAVLALLGENERLRGALEKIAATDLRNVNAHAQGWVKDFIAYARAALNQEQPA